MSRTEARSPRGHATGQIRLQKSIATRAETPEALAQLDIHMAQLVLSNGVTVQSENIRHAEYYPQGSLRTDSFLNGLLIRREQHFLFIRLLDGNAHVKGTGAAQDAAALERVGVNVYRRPVPVIRAS
jgi:hypothetical protein